MRSTCCIGLALVLALLAPAKAPEASFIGSPFTIAEHTPGYRLNAEGQRAWDRGWYFEARHKFRLAAWYGDKLAQYNLGVMYYRGDGVERDAARAWAWFALAAERDYPDFVEIWQTAWHELDEDNQVRAQRILAELEPRYSDRVAIDRTARKMERDHRKMTGSRTGFVGTLRILDGSGRSRDGEEFYRAEKWDFRQIVEAETRIFRALARGTVTLGDLEIIEEEIEVDSEDEKP